MTRPQVTPVDPFDLPDWLGTGEVTWTAHGSIHAGHHVDGRLVAGPDSVDCDLLAVDQAYPEPVVSEECRRDAHQAWTYGQVLLVEYGGRLTVAVPGTGFTADDVLTCLGRLAKAVGADPSRFLAALRL